MWAIALRSDRLHHAPATDRAVLEHLEDEPFDHQAQPADDEQLPSITSVFEILLGIEDDQPSPQLVAAIISPPTTAIQRGRRPGEARR